MVPLNAASMENGSAGLLWVENDGGSTRRKGEAEVRRLDKRPTRLFLGEPRLWLMGVDLVVFGEESVLRTEGTEGLAVSAGLAWTEGVDIKANFAGLTYPASLILDFLVGELKSEGSTFSESTESSKISEARRLPVDEVGLGFSGEEKVFGDCEMAFCLFFALWSAWRRGVPSSANGWRVNKAISKRSYTDEREKAI